MTRAPILAILPVLLAACEGAAVTPPPPPAATFTARVTTIEPQAIAETYTTTGTLIADDRVEIASRLIGYIRDIRVREGETVQQGQLLLTIDPTEIEAQLSEAEARVAQARARVAEAQADYQRHKKLFEQRLIAARQFTRVKLARELAEEELRAALATLERIRVQLQYAEIRSPVPGVVVEKHRQAGDIATPGAPILTIENPDNIVLRTYIREDHLRHVQPGDEVGITVDAAGLRTTGIVTQVVPSGDPATHSYRVKATLNDRTGVRSGMFARAEFSMGVKWGILVPGQALVTRADLPGVYVVDEAGIAHFRMVRTGRRFGGRVEILAGLEAGERIVVEPAPGLRTGDRIIAPDRDTEPGQASGP